MIFDLFGLDCPKSIFTPWSNQCSEMPQDILGSIFMHFNYIVLVLSPDHYMSSPLCKRNVESISNMEGISTENSGLYHVTYGSSNPVMDQTIQSWIKQSSHESNPIVEPAIQCKTKWSVFCLTKSLPSSTFLSFQQAYLTSVLSEIKIFLIWNSL